jgi:tetratricopeptide (TPR) repeat protein
MTMLGLVMIVKDEARGIAETVASVRPYIDRWTILDTGSTDATRDIVHRELTDIPGELHEEPFVDFSTTRNRVLELHGESTRFVIMLSGDDIMVGANAIRPHLERATETIYYVERQTGHDRYKQAVVVQTEAGWRYVGRTHEVLVKHGCFASEAIPGVSIVRRRPESKRARWEHDIKLLELDLTDDPQNARATFYLAQTYECLGRWQAALGLYERRIKMAGWHEETYEAMFRRARILAANDFQWPLVQQAYLEAHAFNPRRAEPLYVIAKHYHDKNDHALAYLFALRASQLKQPDTAAFVHAEVYEWLAADICAIHAYYLPDARDDGRRAADIALRARPDDQRLMTNRAFYGQQGIA